MKKIKLAIKIKIIRWALKQLAVILKERPNISFGGLEKLGIEDFEYMEEWNQFRIDIFAPKRETH